MTTVTNKQLVKAFKAAKEYLWNGKSFPMKRCYDHEFICYALEQAYCLNNITYDEKEETRKIIENSIKPWGSVFNWLELNAKVPTEQLTHEAVQTYRHEWLDHLIKEFSE